MQMTLFLCHAENVLQLLTLGNALQSKKKNYILVI